MLLNPYVSMHDMGFDKFLRVFIDFLRVLLDFPKIYRLHRPEFPWGESLGLAAEGTAQWNSNRKSNGNFDGHSFGWVRRKGQSKLR